jgi:hypothetical protein
MNLLKDPEGLLMRSLSLIAFSESCQQPEVIPLQFKDEGEFGQKEKKIEANPEPVGVYDVPTFSPLLFTRN